MISCGLKTPSTLIKAQTSCLCIKAAASLPFDDEYVPGPVCTICCPGLQVIPNIGCCTTPFSQKWLDDHADFKGVGDPAACEMTGR